LSSGFARSHLLISYHSSLVKVRAPRPVTVLAQPCIVARPHGGCQTRSWDFGGSGGAWATSRRPRTRRVPARRRTRQARPRTDFGG
jgi:hypothetical protein